MTEPVPPARARQPRPYRRAVGPAIVFGGAWLTHIVMAAKAGEWLWLAVGAVLAPVGMVVGFSWWWHWLVRAFS
jgi:fatty acid desaturase